MCYLPIKCLRAIVFIGSIFSIALSITLLALTIYVQVQKKQILSAANSGTITGSLVALYLSSILFLLLGVAGLSGSMKSFTKKGSSGGTCLLGLFSIGVMVFFVLFLGGTIFFFVGPQAIFGTDCTQGSQTTLINELYATSNNAYTQFCTTTCPCKITDTESGLYKIINLTGVVDNDKGVIKYGDCLNKTSPEADVEFLSAIQNLLKCGGWCPLDKQVANPFGVYYYRFRDINDCSSQCKSMHMQNAIVS